MRSNLDRIIRSELIRGEYIATTRKTGQATHQILHGDLARLIDTLHKFEYEMSKAVNNGDTDIIVILVLCDCQSRCISKGLRSY